MGLGPFRSVIVVIGGAAAITVGALLLRSQPGRDAYASTELVRGLCNRDVVIPPPYRSQARELRRLVTSGTIDRWEDVSFRSRNPHQDVYLPYPDENLNEAGIRLNIIDVYLRGEKVFEMRIPAVLLPNPVISMNLPERRYRSCLDVMNNDFLDYM